MRKLYTILLAPVMAFAAPSAGGTPQAAATGAYQEYMARALDIWGFTGAVLVARGDRVLWREGYGYANREAEITNRPETRFLIGSMTKIFTAIAVLQLVQAGRIDLHASLSVYLPDYPADVGRRVTVHHLLSHTSGLADVLRNPAFVQRIAEPIAPEEIVALFRDEPLGFEPGTGYAYTNSNYVLLGLIIEAVTGKAWATQIEESICQPCGLDATRVYADYCERAQMTTPGVSSVLDEGTFAVGYVPDRTGNVGPAPFFHLSRGYGAGALASTVDDLFRLDRALARQKILDEATIKLMLTPHGDAYGYGWIVDRFGNHQLTAHGGGVPGQVSMFQRWVADSLCVVVLSNRAPVPVHQVANGLAAIALGEPCELPSRKSPARLAEGQLRAYVGRYRLANGEMRRILLEGGQLRAQRGQGPSYVILPEEAARFYFAHDPMTTMTFLRDEAGGVIGHILRQAFDADTAWLAAE